MKRLIIVLIIISFAVGLGFASNYESDEVNHDFVRVEVREGWTLSEIASGVGVTVKHLMKLNNLNSPKIFPRQKLKVIPYSDFTIGKVSWYGARFHGNKMANGEPFNMHDEGIVAHKWLPFGTKVRLTHTETGKSIIVKVQDRGPYVGNRQFDLSKAAARKLGSISEGVATCKIEILT